jgi:hypothetical protein
MEVRRCADQELPAVGPLGPFSDLCTELEVVIHGLGHLLTEFIHRTPLESHNILKANNAAMESVDRWVKLKDTGVTFVPDHGRTPAFSRNRRTSSSVAFPASLLGCGPWERRHAILQPKSDSGSASRCDLAPQSLNEPFDSRPPDISPSRFLKDVLERLSLDGIHIE